jgi:protein O-mannosyl-transferase
MDIIKTTEKKDMEEEFSFKKFFFPLTPVKAIHWIIFIGLVVYGNVLFNGFIWDDLTFIINNPAIHPFNIPYLFSINPFNNGGYYRPIPAVYFSLLWNLFGNISFFYHLVQILLHIAGVCLLFIFLKRFFSRSLAFFLVLIFLVHPIQVESVAYIGATQSELIFLTGMGALLLSIKETLSWKSLSLMAFLLLLSLLTKETAVLFFLIIFCYQLLFFGRRVRLIIPYLILPVIPYAFIRFVYAGIFLKPNLSSPIGQLPLSERLTNIPAIVFYYLKTFFYPVQLSIDQRWYITTVNFQQVYLPLLLDCLFFVLLIIPSIYLFKHKKKFLLYLFFFVWFVSGLGILLQIFPLDMTVADRWFYFPIVGLLGMVGIFLQSVNIQNHVDKRILFSFAMICILLLSVRTTIRNTNYVDVMALYTHDIRTAPQSFDLEYQLGRIYADAGNDRKARMYYMDSIQDWKCSSAQAFLGVLDEKEQNLTGAKKQYLKAIQCYDWQNAYGSLVKVLFELHQYNLADHYIEEGLAKKPTNIATLYFIRGVIEYQRGDKKDALSDMVTSYKYNNDPLIIKTYNEIEKDQKVVLPAKE